MRNKQNNELAVCGLSAVKKLEKHNWQQIRRLYFTEDTAPLFGGLCKKLANAHGIYNSVTSAELQKLSGTVHHQGVVAMIHTPEITALDADIVNTWIAKKQNVLVLDHIGNANNFGAIVRSAAFFGMKNIVLANDEGQQLITTSSYRIAEGGMESVKIYSVHSLERLLEITKNKMIRIGTDLNATTPSTELPALCRTTPALVIMGNEENGISDTAQKNCDHLILIPFAKNKSTTPAVQSLNVAQATSIILYELSKLQEY
ncbi:MAG: RNA methyltransferase [Treponema sp.]|nr:RNA methyltransferase [Treponema sp.]